MGQLFRVKATNEEVTIVDRYWRASLCGFPRNMIEILLGEDGKEYRRSELAPAWLNIGELA